MINHLCIAALYCGLLSAAIGAPGDLSIAADSPLPAANTYFGLSLASEGSTFWAVRAATIQDGNTRIYRYAVPRGTSTLIQTLRNWSGGSESPPIAANEGLLAFQHLRVSPSETTELYTVFNQGTNTSMGTATSPTGNNGCQSIAVFNGKLFVGNPDETVGGQTHVFSLNGSYDQTLFNPRLSTGQDFGFEMGVAAPNRLAILDRYRGLHVYDENLSRTLELFLSNGFDYQTMAAGSGYVAFTDNGGSKVTIYNAVTSAKVREIPRPTSGLGGFGGSLAISGDLIAIGCYSNTVNTVSQVGTVALYRISTGEQVVRVDNPLMATNPALAEGSNFGRVLAPYRGSFLVGFHEWSPNFTTRNVGRVYLLEGEALAGINDWELY